jgi:hypothetical protein
MISTISLGEKAFDSNANHVGRVKLTHLVVGPDPEPNSFDVLSDDGIPIC